MYFYQYTYKGGELSRIKLELKPLIYRHLMLKTLLATVRQGKIELSEKLELPEGTKVLVTVLPNEEADFWQQTSQVALNRVWDNTEDDIYAQLLEE